MIEPLLAKSIPTTNSIIPGYARLVPHLKAVERAGNSILDIAGALILNQVGLDYEPWFVRLKAVLNCACLSHDLGKANSAFQQMVRGKLDPRKQPARHELLSVLLLREDNGPVNSWAKEFLSRAAPGEDVEILLKCVVGAVAGHHQKMDEEWKKAALALRGGCGDMNLRLLLHHKDLKSFLGSHYSDRELTYSLIDDEPRYIGDFLVPFRFSSNNWARTLKVDDDWRRFAAVTKALVMAADAAGSAILPEGGKTNIRQWIHKALERTLSAHDLAMVVKRRLRENSPRLFQDEVGNSSARITVVEAGCGTGKTLAAYMWARNHSIGRKLFFCYPTTGTATEGFLGYVHETNVEARLVHSRAIVDLEGISKVVDEDNDEHCLRIESLSQWSPQVIVCTADTVLGLVRNNRRSMYNSPAILMGSFVFDEIHSYDDTLFASLLAFMDALPGASFLLMSASLPEARREILLNRYEEIFQAVGPSDLQEIPRYLFERTLSETEVISACHTAVNSGKHVLWVSNTVSRAQAIARRLEEREIRCIVYHSRFQYKDRVEKHREVVAQFSSEGAERQDGVVAVATQVAEMSLDLDADLLISDLAPIPALIQRLGRLNRHLTMEISGAPRRALLLTPKSVAPYCKEDLRMTEEWLDYLIEQDHPLSQTDLAFALNKFFHSKGKDIETRSRWLDYGWFAVAEPCRDAGYSVSVLLQEDLLACKREKSEMVKRIIPMNFDQEIMSRWQELNGILIAPEGAVSYSTKYGAELCRS